MERNFHTIFSNVVHYINVLPYIYRYEDEEYIEKFFTKGEILLSSFKQYKKYEDNELGDPNEGSSYNFGNTTNEKMVMTYTQTGGNAYTLCTSTVLDTKLLTAFKRNSVFRIKDPINFILQIEKTIPMVIQVLIGNCIYVKQRRIEKKLPAMNLEDFRDDKQPDKMSLEKMMAATAPLHKGPEPYFFKLLDYQHQNEFRIIWDTSRQSIDRLLVTCPEASKYCERITAEELNTINS